MKYDVHHRTTYRYSQTVSYSFHLAHLTPRETPAQRVDHSETTLSVTPVRHDRRSDYFGNIAQWFAIEQPHTVLEVLSQSRVRVEPVMQKMCQMPWVEVRAMLAEAEAGAARDATQYFFDSPLVKTDDVIAAYAAKSFPEDRSIADAALDLMHRIHKDFRYDTTVTDATTSVTRVFEVRAGVCQDLAHVGIAALRALGLSGRYVSGYLVTKPPPGQPRRLVGADASHAWFSVWTPEGWLDCDPTNDMRPGEGHIICAWGRDYSDVAPINGIVSGGGDHIVEVGVDVTPA